MDEMRAWYRGFLQTRIDALETARDAYLAGERESGESIRRLAHSLKGSGSMYGFHEISERAGAVEHAPDADLVARLNEFVPVLRTVAGEASPETVQNILVVDDDPAIQRYIQALIEGSARHVLGAGTIREAEEKLRDQPVALIVLDLVLPDGDGRRLLMRLKSRTATANIPVIVLTSRRSLAAQKECFALGADDFLEKPFDAETLSPLISARLEKAAEAMRESRRDFLTSLPNRAAFRESFEKSTEHPRRGGKPLSLAMIDIDRFKSVNDTYGHATGDVVLQRFALLVSASLRASDTLARWGGDEFVALFPETDAQGARVALEEARSALAREVFHTVDGRKFHITISAGIAEWGGSDDLDESLSEADRFLYAAKSSGRDRIVTSRDLSERTRLGVLVIDGKTGTEARIIETLDSDHHRVAIVADAGAAIETALRDHFDLVIVDAATSGRRGFEFLEALRSSGHDLPPILVITPPGAEKDAYRALELGASDFIIQPFTPGDLLGRIRRICEGGKRR